MSTAIEKVCKDLGFTEEKFIEFCSLAPHRYKKFFIPKKNGAGLRLVAQPARPLKKVQRWLVSEYLSKLPIHEAAAAYVSEKSILDNAKKHAGNKVLVKYDFKDFFPSIKPSDFLKLISKNDVGISAYEAEIFSRLIFWSPGNRPGLELCIGAPSSPVISNAVMFDFDNAVSEFCSSESLIYTRYADDICISGYDNSIFEHVDRFIKKQVFEIESPNLLLNPNKTQFINENTVKKVTGLFITQNEEITVGRKLKRKVRAMVHNFHKGNLSAKDKERLKGYLCYLSDVDPSYLRKVAPDFQSWDL
ncbi:retron St85 family RNA-directed DNA polymerase [Marinobacter orientalis]|uniref:RNA-directed DNA polymerase n=1 Tax=Marinobacter orientalis TaxID=1928859 RepID=A0A7Y0WS86_9GAMM|nr:retron St85 family RNA-directed DNA polymerase [Marinobacter orientalis]NMT63654.1 RNA-directed DNA polymerase [Marinobacter orientalis]TGX49769.1 RNA-directed DNA polymerase [Marinobacter orientalis]